jgi:predicted RNase H-like HicB family nuclease
MSRYAVVIGKADHNFAGCVPYVPGCVATGKTEQEVRKLLREAIAMHLDGMRETACRFPSRRARWTSLELEIPAQDGRAVAASQPREAVLADVGITWRR